jgi:hypothetical protein
MYPSDLKYQGFQLQIFADFFLSGGEFWNWYERRYGVILSWPLNPIIAPD